jgi:hypothetical protein
VARRLIVGLALLVALPVAAAQAAERPGIHYASRLDGTDAFIGIVKQGPCFKAYLSDGTAEGATLSVWFQGCLGPDGRTLNAERGGVRLDAQLDRRTATGTITLRDGSVRSRPRAVIAAASSESASPTRAGATAPAGSY